jgi:hypothetical protein
MAQIILIKREKAGDSFNYTYDCFCAPKPLKQFVVTAGNDQEAQVFAQQECNEYCGQQSKTEQPQ